MANNSLLMHKQAALQFINLKTINPIRFLNGANHIIILRCHRPQNLPNYHHISLIFSMESHLIGCCQCSCKIVVDRFSLLSCEASWTPYEVRTVHLHIYDLDALSCASVRTVPLGYCVVPLSTRLQYSLDLKKITISILQWSCS
jgi:hypothetical protein